MIHSDRKISVYKNVLIEKVEENKQRHIKQYNQAVIDYKKEALKQLEELKQKVKEGDLELKLNLVTPIDNTKEYDAIIDMFNWDVNEILLLSIDEFRHYVQDENDFARQASFSNTYYSSTN